MKPSVIFPLVRPRIGFHQVDTAAEFLQRPFDIGQEQMAILIQIDIAPPFFKELDAQLFFHIPDSPVQTRFGNVQGFGRFSIVFGLSQFQEVLKLL